MNQIAPDYAVLKKRALACGLLILLLLCLLRAQEATKGKAKVAVSYPQPISKITFVVAGDVIPHQAVVEAAAAQEKAQPKPVATSVPAESIPADPKNGAAPPSQPVTADPQSQMIQSSDDHGGWDLLFTNVADIFHHADFGFVNLETPVAPKHSLGTKAFQFDAPVALLQALKFNGVKVVSFANNHVLDQGQPGFAETLDHLREEGMLFVGSGATEEDAWKPLILEKNGIKVGWLGITRHLNGHRNSDKADEPHVAFFPYPDDKGESKGAPSRDEAGVMAAITAARAQCDLLLVSIHWGVEYAPAPLPQDVDLAHKMLEAGAGAIIGHHPHVLQPIETYQTQDQRNTVIIYSLGNFLSNQSRNYVEGLMPDKAGDPRDSMIVKFSVIKKDYGPAGVRVELGEMGLLPAWGENNHLQLQSGHTKIACIRPVLIDREIPKLQTEVDDLTRLGDQLSADQKKELVQLSSELETLKHRRELLLSRTGDEYLISPP